jgi:acyl-[acyl-carrier-protein]-phospholipid O-acyltransferase/long-chain-fatty-acid--[acyl-carrier-protein] ligase
MNSASPPPFGKLLRWTARLLGLVSLGILLTFMIGEGFNPLRFAPRGWALCLCFPIGLMAGLLLAWRWELAGGLVAVLGTLGFYGLHFAFSGGLPRGGAFLALAAPAFLSLASSLVNAPVEERGAADAASPRAGNHRSPWLALPRALLRLLFHFRAYNEAALAAPGPVLLLPNHTSWIDWLFLGVSLDDDWRFVTSSVTAQTSPVHRFLMINRRTFPIDPLSPYAVKRMAEYLQGGGRLVLFPEGRLSRTGCLMKLFDGTGFLLHKTGARVITAYLRGPHRLPFSPNKDQKRWCPRITAHYSPALTPPRLENASTAQARAYLTGWLTDQMRAQYFQVEMEFGPQTVPAALLQTARFRAGHYALEDVAGKLTYRRFMQAAALLARQLDSRAGVPPAPPAAGPGPGRRDAGPTAERVGVLLPNANALPLTLLALWSLGRVPAILNYTTGPAVMRLCCEVAGLRCVVTSRLFIQRARLDLAPLQTAGVEFLFLEDLRAGIDAPQKLAAALGWVRLTVPEKLAPQDTAVVLFTSGSEGVPKGVELTHRNLLANLRQMLAVCDMQDTERFFNALPLFHSMGLTAGMLLPLVRGAYVFLYPSPLHYRVVPTVLYERDCTVTIGTNTFLNGYARRAHVYDFRSIRYLFAGAEKVQEATAELWAHKFGVRLLEGYGATECSPVICVNTPLQPKHGSAGRFLPGIEYRLEPVEGVSGDRSAECGVRNDSVPGVGQSPITSGRLFVRGPNVMKGYLNPEANAQFQALGGWYDTGDIVRVDAEGFVFILGRMKRFAKVSGEMISLTAVEDALAGAFPEFGLRCQVAVIARPDEDKGERLIAVTNEPHLTLDQVRAAIKAKGLGNLCVPREVVAVKEIPKLGTGKVNHRELAKLVPA